MKVYTILIKQETKNSILFSNEMIEIIKRHNGAVVLSGYNQLKFVCCLAFMSSCCRDQCAAELETLGVKYKTRDDGIIDDGFKCCF